MFFHVLIKLNRHNDPLTKFDIVDEDEVISKYILPYIKDEKFFFDDRFIKRNMITSFKIFKTKLKSNEVKKILHEKRSRENSKSSYVMLFAETQEDAVRNEVYSSDITEEMIAKAQAIPKKEVVKPTQTVRTNSVDVTKIFIVHGHNEAIQYQTARFIEKLDFEAIILHEQANGGQTIIEKLEEYTKVGFAIVLYTACDVGASKANSDNLNSRARQNVVFEHGYLIGKLGRSRVCALVEKGVETPSDISGVVYISLSEGNWELQLVKELKKAGYPADANKI